MAKLQIIPRYTKDGTRKTAGYKMTISLCYTKLAGFDENSKLKLTAEKGKITITEEK